MLASEIEHATGAGAGPRGGRMEELRARAAAGRRTMATLSVGQKAQKKLRFLMGLRHPVIAQIMASYGFTKADLDEGWSLLQRQSATSLDVLPARGVAGPEALAKLDAWEN